MKQTFLKLTKLASFVLHLVPMRLRRLLLQLQFPAVFYIVILDVVLSVSVTKQLDVDESKVDIEKSRIRKLVYENCQQQSRELPFQHSNELIEWDSICAMYRI